MPIINITDIDNTTGGAIATGSDVVFVPGVTGLESYEEGKTPKVKFYKFSSVSEFTAKIGTAPVKATADIKVGTGSDAVTVIKKDAFDPGYQMAKELLAAGLEVVYGAILCTKTTTGSGASEKTTYSIPTDLYTTLTTDVFHTDISKEGILDKGSYDIKYVTSGGYPAVLDAAGKSVTLANSIKAFVETRGDCVGLIDYKDGLNVVNDIEVDTGKTDGEGNPIKEKVTKNLAQVSGVDSSYCAMFAPWATYSRATVDTYTAYTEKPSDDKDNSIDATETYKAPASFGYLLALAKSIQTNPNWLAIAGVSRGRVTRIVEGGIDKPITNTLANKLQPNKTSDAYGGMSINAITNINPYGDTIWGNRTLAMVGEKGVVAGNSLHLRNLVSDIKKVCYTTARDCMFEQDTDTLWVNFKAGVSGLLDRMKAGNGISAYRLVRVTDVAENEHAGENGTMCVKVIIYPTFAVENFYITVVLRNDEVTVE